MESQKELDDLEGLFTNVLDIFHPINVEEILTLINHKLIDVVWFNKSSICLMEKRDEVE